jgi:hypothetical protein
MKDQFDRDQFLITKAMTTVHNAEYAIDDALVEPYDVFPYQPVIKELVIVRDTAIDLCKELAISAVQQGLLSRREVAQQIGVHHVTISRWLLARETEQPE